MHIRSEKVTSDIGLPLRNEVSRIQMRSFLQGNDRLDCQNFDKVDWEAMDHKMQKNTNTPQDMDYKTPQWILWHE